MADKHEVIDISSLREAVPPVPKSADQVVRDRLRGRSFSQLTQQEKDDLLMVVGVQLGIIAPESSEH